MTIDYTQTNHPNRDPEKGGAGLQLLDPRGCLTAEALCFIQELHPDQQALVYRHLRDCMICSQLQTQLSQAAARVRRARPRVPAPVEARVAARQAALRTMVQNVDRSIRQREAPTPLAAVPAQAATGRRLSLLLIACAAAFVAGGLAIFLWF